MIKSSLDNLSVVLIRIAYLLRLCSAPLLLIFTTIYTEEKVPCVDLYDLFVLYYVRNRKKRNQTFLKKRTKQNFLSKPSSQIGPGLTPRTFPLLTFVPPPTASTASQRRHRCLALPPSLPVKKRGGGIDGSSGFIGRERDGGERKTKGENVCETCAEPHMFQ